MTERTLPQNRYYVYVLSRANGTPFYIGKGCGARWRQHQYAHLRIGKNHKVNAVNQAIARFGDIPKIKIAENLSSGTASELERLFISIIGRHPNGPLLNATAGGDGVQDADEETRWKLGSGNRGRKLSAEHRAKLSAAHLGRTFTPEHRARIGAGTRRNYQEHPERREQDRIRSSNPSPELRAKLIAGQLRRGPRSPEVRANIARGHTNPSEETRQRMSKAAKSREEKKRADIIAKKTAKVPEPK